MKGNVQILQFVVVCSALTTTDLGIRMFIRSELWRCSKELHHFIFCHSGYYFINKSGILHVMFIPYSPIVVG